MRALYTLLFIVLIPIILARLWWRGANQPAYRKRWRERFGLFSKPIHTKTVIWVHTVSVGEFIAAKPLLDALLTQNRYTLAITTMTPTGSERVQAAYGKQIGNNVFHVYAPYDIPFCINAFLTKIKPSLAIFLETELWPNTLHACAQKGIPTLLANARLSEKSARGYKKISWLAKPMLQNLTFAAIQNKEDAARFKRLGLHDAHMQVIGSIKFDITLTNTLIRQASQLKAALSHNQQYKLWIAASTHKGEDDIILAAFKRLRTHQPNTRLVLVPRHPDRFNRVYQDCERSGFVTLRRSEYQQPEAFANTDSFDILLGDTMGEMMLLYGAVDAAFIGGSFVNNGGHNAIEAAVWQLPILSGPSQFNFTDITRLLTDAGGQSIVEDATALANTLHSLLSDTAKASEMGRAAATVAKQNQGALARLITVIDDTVQP
ncbi:lipid IV(A) 3-deoxy-D-manno-octulosonic acid transferase [Teredinibacter purpureus]|uniref:lipid IV(A) 3-deoxy-D-manno-octulosonic acid transferase n=1 Tax=Teredinibacter purpureus TaxID=2731756 RepID=UPI0005F82BAB|nr:lipid IV(A) 3-deoxy-D-manno-octulosonic acid transferase [Teredinibacter purpureus]